MRLKEGDIFSVFNTQGEWNASVQNYEKQGAKIKILEKIRDKKNEQNIWLAFTPIKQNPLNFIIQKGTELGFKNLFQFYQKELQSKILILNELKKLL